MWLARIWDIRWWTINGIISLVHDFQKVAHEVLNEVLKMCEHFQVLVVIYKLPYTLKDYKNTPRH